MPVAHNSPKPANRHLSVVDSSTEDPTNNINNTTNVNLDPSYPTSPTHPTSHGTSRDVSAPHTVRAPSRQSAKQARARRRAELSDEARQLRNAVLRAALASGYAINPNAVSVIFGAKSHQQGPLRYFTEDTVWDLVWFDISHWCGTRNLDLPEGLHRALWFILDYLDASGELHPHSDHLDDLRAPLLSSTGLGPDGQPRFEF